MTVQLAYAGNAVGQAKNSELWRRGVVGFEQCLAAVLQIPHGTATTDYSFQIGAAQSYGGTTTNTFLSAKGLLKGFTGTAYYYITRAIVNNPSADISLATSGLFTAAGGTGTTIITDAALTTLNAATATLCSTRTIASGGTGNLFTTASNGTLYYRVGTNVTGNADFYLFGIVLP